MSNNALSPPEQCQLVSVRSRNWIVPHVAPSTLPPPALKPVLDQSDSRTAQQPEIRYKADITAGALKVPESQVIADLLLGELDGEGCNDAIMQRKVLQARNPATGIRLARLIRGRLETMQPDLWRLIRDGSGPVATHAALAAAVKAVQRVYPPAPQRQIPPGKRCDSAGRKRELPIARERRAARQRMSMQNRAFGEQVE